MAKGDSKTKSDSVAKVEKKSKKVEKKEEVVEKVEAKVVTETEDETKTAAEDLSHGSVFDQQLEEIAQLKRNVDESVRKLTCALKVLKKQVAKDMKVRSKGRGRGARQSRDGVERAKSGFTAPTNLSEELCKFLGKPPGTMMARTEVTRELTAYIKTNNLNNGREILPNAQLAKLLRAKDTDNVTYFNLQKFMKPHFARKDGSFDALV